MTYNRLSHEYRPYEIHYRVPDNFGRLSGPRVHSKHMTDDERDQEYDRLNHKGAIKYSKHTNLHELEGQAAALERIK